MTSLIEAQKLTTSIARSRMNMSMFYQFQYGHTHLNFYTYESFWRDSDDYLTYLIKRNQPLSEIEIAYIERTFANTPAIFLHT